LVEKIQEWCLNPKASVVPIPGFGWGFCPKPWWKKKNILWEYNEEIFITNGVM